MPSSFTRRTTASTPIPPVGCFSSPSTSSLFLLPTGLPSLDDILGGGLPLGSILLVIAPDGNSTWGKLVEKYFTSQGLISGQELIVVGEDSSTREMVKGSMWVEKGSSTAGAGEGSESENETGSGPSGHGAEGGVGSEDAKKIAWRYEKLSKFKTTTSGGGHNAPLSLTTMIPNEVLSKAESSNQLTYIPLVTKTNDTSSSNSASHAHGQDNVFDRTIAELYTKLNGDKSKNAKRVVVHELGSLDWTDGDDIKSEQIHRFIHSLRYILRNVSSTTSALITLPSNFISAFGTAGSSRGSSSSSDIQALVKSLSWAVDGCVELRGFADDPTLPPLFPTTHGLLTLHSYPTSHTLLPNTLKHSTLLGVAQSSASSSSSSASGGGGGGAGENNLGFKLKRKKFVLETVHLGVEGGTSERRTEPPPISSSDTLTSGSGSGPGGVRSTVEQGQVEGEVEGIEKPDKGNEITNTTTGQTKKSKPRVKVRFGDDQILVGKDEPSQQHDHQHEHHHHDHQHDHDLGKSTGTSAGAGPTVPRVELRHDRPDLYEF